MNILHLALISPDNDGMIDRGFRARGHEVRRVDWKGSQANEQATANAEWADVCFYQGQGSMAIAGKTLDRLRENGVFVINWTGDVRDDVEWYKAMAPHVDLTLFTNGTDIDLMREAGFKADYMQVGYNEEVYHNDGNEERSGVVFMGQNSGNRFPESQARALMVERMRSEFGKDFAVYGHGWGTKYLLPEQEADTYRRALVAINFDHYHRPGFASDRLLRATACGCYVVSQFYKGIAEEHPHTAGAGTIEQMLSMVRKALDSPEQTKKLGEWGAANTMANHQWSNRTERMEQLIDQYR